MKVGQSGPVGGTSGARRGDKAASARPGEFSRHLDGAKGPGTVSASSPISGVDALLAAQAVDTAGDEGRRRAVQRGEDILDRLDDIRHGLLTGSLTMGQIQSLAALVRTRRDSVADPQLRELLGEIELRAEVEIAKLSAAVP
jgi:hypothetical protein